MPEIVGVTYPIPKQFTDCIFKGKDVFVKPATVWKQLKSGIEFVFYQSPMKILALLVRLK